MKILYDDWEARGRERYGMDQMQWKFRCPNCNRVSTISEWVNNGVGEAMGFACVSALEQPRFHGDLAFKLKCDQKGEKASSTNPITVRDQRTRTERPMFDFADRPLKLMMN